VGIVSHAKIVADCAQARKVMDMARDLMVAAQNASPSDLHQQAAKLAQASEPREMHRSDASALDLIRDFADRDQPDAKPVRPPIPTPWPGLTRILNGGWTGGNRPYYFGARRKNGKTSAGLGIAADAAFNRGFKVILFEIEIAMEATLNRLVSLCSEVPHKSILDRRFTADEHVRYVQALELCYNNNLRIDASRVIGKGQRGVNVIGSKTIEAIRKTIARVVAEGPLDLIVVDHLQVIQPPFPCPIFERVTQASNGLAAITQEFGIPVVAMLQLNDAKGGEPPTALDTRGGQEIGNDCEALILLDRPPLRRSQKEQERLSPAEKEEAALIVALHGSGETGTIPMTYRGECMRWYQAGHETY
jgi:replicative DNA helicase